MERRAVEGCVHIEGSKWMYDREQVGNKGWWCQWGRLLSVGVPREKGGNSAGLQLGGESDGRAVS
jgi:hypothetical protein